MYVHTDRQCLSQTLPDTSLLDVLIDSSKGTFKSQWQSLTLSRIIWHDQGLVHHPVEIDAIGGKANWSYFPQSRKNPSFAPSTSLLLVSLLMLYKWRSPPRWQSKNCYRCSSHANPPNTCVVWRHFLAEAPTSEDHWACERVYFGKTNLSGKDKSSMDNSLINKPIWIKSLSVSVQSTEHLVSIKLSTTCPSNSCGWGTW